MMHITGLNKMERIEIISTGNWKSSAKQDILQICQKLTSTQTTSELRTKSQERLEKIFKENKNKRYTKPMRYSEMSIKGLI